MNGRRISRLALLAAIPVLTGCEGIAHWSAYVGGASRFQPDADGPAAMQGAIAVIPGLHMAFARPTTLPGAFGPGSGRFNSNLLEAFSVDGDLNPDPALGTQPGFFLRPSSSLSGRRCTYCDPHLSMTGTGGSDELIAWGRWEGRGLTLGTRGSFTEGPFHYAIGQLTPAVRLPQSGLAQYLAIGGEAGSWLGDRDDPGDIRNRQGTSFNALAVLWGTSTTKIGLRFFWSDPTHGQVTPGGVVGQAGGMVTSGGLDTVSGLQQSEVTLRPGTATFAGTNIPASCGGGPGRTCLGTVEGFFAGPNAERAGVAFQATETGAGEPAYLVSGVFAFAFSEFTIPPAPPAPPPAPLPGGATLLDQTDPSAFAISFAHSGGLAGQPASGPPATATQSAGGQLETFASTGGSPGSQINIGRGTAQSPAAETGGDSLITWGRWTGGTTTGTAGVGPLTLGPNQGFHYVVGAATPPANIPAAGTATFTLMGATMPTFTDGALAPGTFTGSMAVQWGGAAATKVGVNFNVTMPGDGSYQIQSNGGVANPGSSLISTSLGNGGAFTGPATVTGAGRACPLGCTSGNVNGFFAGPAAQRAGVTYAIGLGPTSIQGAAAFTR